MSASSLTAACVPFARRLTAYGVSFEIRGSSADLLEEACIALPPFTRPTEAARVGRQFILRAPTARCACGQPHDRMLIVNGRQRITTPQSRADVLDAVRIWIKQYVAEHMRGRFCMHAGVVAMGDRAVVIPGTSMSGKTTLTAALVRAGATYYSDEYAVVGGDGRIRAFPQMLGMRQPGRPEQTHTDVAALSGTVGRTPVRARLVLFTQHQEGSVWAPREMPRAELVMMLLPHVLGLQKRPARAMQMLTAMTAGAIGLEGARGDADATAAVVLDRLKTL